MKTINRIVEWCALAIELLAASIIISGVAIIAITRGMVRYLFRLQREGHTKVTNNN